MWIKIGWGRTAARLLRGACSWSGLKWQQRYSPGEPTWGFPPCYWEMMNYTSISAVLELGLKANSCLPPSMYTGWIIAVLPLVLQFLVCFVYFSPQLHSFLCFLICGGMEEGSQLTIAVSKSFKMVRCPFCLFEGHRILYECFPYRHFSNRKNVFMLWYPE